MGIGLKGRFRMISNMGKGILSGMMAPLTKATSPTTSSKVLVSSNGQTAENTRGTSKIPNNMARASSPMQMDENMMGNTSRIKNTDKEHFSFLIRLSTRVGGKITSNMVKESTQVSMEKKNAESGKREKLQNGLRKKIISKKR